MKKFYWAYWEVANEDRDDYFQSMEKQFTSFKEALEWLGEKDFDPDYYCDIIDETGRVIHTGWMP